MGSAGITPQQPPASGPAPGGGASRKRAVLRGLLLVMAVAAALVLFLWPEPRKPRVRGVLSVGTEKEVVLPDPPAPVLLRWKFPPGQTLIYTLSEKETERLGQSTRVVDSSGTLTFRGLGDGRGEAELVLLQGRPGGGPPTPDGAPRQQAATGEEEEPPASQAEGGPPGTPAPSGIGPGSPEAPPLRQTLILDSRGRPVGTEVRAEAFLRILGVDFALPEEGLKKGSPVDTKKESALGMGAAGLLTRRQTWTRTVERNLSGLLGREPKEVPSFNVPLPRQAPAAGARQPDAGEKRSFPCLRVEGQSYEDTSTPPQAGSRILTTRRATSLCHFAYDEGYLVEWAVEREEEITSAGERGAKTRAGTIFRSQEISLKLAEVR